MSKEIDKLKKAAKESADKICNSTYFISLFTEKYKEDPVCLMQLALAILMDKPIYLLVPNDVMPNLKLLKLCDGWEFYDRTDEDSIKNATERLLTKLRKEGV